MKMIWQEHADMPKKMLSCGSQVLIQMWQRVWKGVFFSQQVIKANNSINPIGEHVAYGYYFPTYWDEARIIQLLDPTRKNIQNVQVVKRRNGQPSGKVLFRFNNATAMQQLINKYNEDYIITPESTHRVVIKPFELRQRQLSKAKADLRTKNAVVVKNLDFDITVAELTRLAKDYGEVKYIDMPMRVGNLNNGLATIYFAKRAQAQDFSHFCHGLDYKQRRLSAEVVNTFKKKEEIEYLKQPTIVMQSNMKIYKRLVAMQGEKSEQK